MILTSSGFPSDSPAGVPLIGWQNVASNVAASSEVTGFPASNLLLPATHLLWRATSNASQTLAITPSGNVNYIAIGKHNFGTAGATVALSRSGSLIPATALTDDSPLIMRFPVGSTALTLTIGAGSVAPQAAVLYAGQLLVLERGVKVDAQHLDLPHARKSNIVSGMSESGNFLGRVELSEYREGKAEFAWFTPSWYRANFEPFVAAAIDTPFFWAWNPADYPNETALAWLIADVQPETDPATRRVAATLSMRGIV